MQTEAMQQGHIPDREVAVVGAIAAGDEHALLQTIAEHGPLLIGLARRITGDAHLAEEIAQDVFVTLWKQADRYDPTRGSLRTFLCAVTRNKATDAIRREESRRRTTAELFREAEFATVDPTLESEGKLYLQWVLAKLTKVQREAIVLAYFGGRTYREVAAELHIPEGTAKTRLRDALAAIRREISSTEPLVAG
jgi:RNA polymerase sigma-70 factor, ECF subfamily